MHTKQLKALLKKHNREWEEFIEWMEGQTVGEYKDGDTNWFDDDVSRFIKRESPRFI